MKKLFAALATVLMIGTTSTTIVACRKPIYDIEILLVPSKDPLEIESQLYTLNKQFQKVFSEVSGSNKKVGFKVSPDYNIAAYVLRSGQAALGMIPVTTYYQKDIKESKSESDRKMGTLFLSTRTAVKTELRAYGNIAADQPASLEELNSLSKPMNDGGLEQDLSIDIKNEFNIAQEANKVYAQDANNIYYTEADKKSGEPIANATHYRSTIFANRKYVEKRKNEVSNLSEGGKYNSRFESYFKPGTFDNNIIKEAYSKLDENLNYDDSITTKSGITSQEAHTIITLDLFCNSMENANTGVLGGAKVGLASSATSGAGMVKPVESLVNNYIIQQKLDYGKDGTQTPEQEANLKKANDFATEVLTGYSKAGGYATELPLKVKEGNLNIGVAFNDGRAELQLKNPNETYLKDTWMVTTSSGIMNDGMLYSKSFFRRNEISDPGEEVLEYPIKEGSIEVAKENMETTGNHLLDSMRKSFLELMNTEEGLSVMRKIYSHEGYTPVKIDNYLKGTPEYDEQVKKAQESALNKVASEVALAINK
ncbi:hypothetical protein STIUS_v1c06480 [Spiroplasma sp. TIUS-1]|uniref:Vmc-like lipoprotein signal peptide domain-containing protein n=1 Tax=Spiroplasma sp. TIUS-1 TaxID=216963 RepID=UPI0013978002|nr:hypothetical protein [Spiroplasma sp. TIUS-1]QHX36202.1 hypothetical protein STIUS_v1c06480 [Spiroplasma sp. TIUS-1]